ncbi:hypothetical protein CAC42_4865 [Sphaceloma murrayae]|uniref:DUF2470 domain-containing protein n=1 Tax=Sphaceloma murrayae TaxID=2082308 RepID=A0A2K1QPF9_9PEZI|nr:hypothetical protein CAC42_4865 [Sphaceloma murrayae]
MAEQAAKDEVAKARIIGHMNADHHDSVIRYLEHYHGQSAWAAATGKITDISLSDITLQSQAGTFKTAIEPAMASFREARERLVAMDKECVQRLGRSDITVRDWQAPYGWTLGLFVTMSAAFVAFSRRANFAPGSFAAAVLPDALRSFCFANQPWVLAFMAVVHGAEAYTMATGRLKRHNVSIRSLAFWQWIADTFIEGFGAFNRFDKLVRDKEIAKAQQKH